jgi:hypothetical protein
MVQLILPSEVEPESLADLVSDCRSIRLPDPAGAAGTADRAGHGGDTAAGPAAAATGVTIPDRTAALLDGMPDYGD